ncbi:MAG: hypothetical protein ACFCUE_12740 [Candidatus Bathyarchaeia archaeon]|jgi:hypothetical protein
MLKIPKPAKQLTLDSLNAASTKQDTNPKPAIKKQIQIIQMETAIGIDELNLKIGFKLEPSRLAFSKVGADLFFEDTHVSSVLIRVLQGPLATDESEYAWLLDTKGIPAGIYRLKVEMYEAWISGEKLHQTSCDVKVDYVPQTRQSRLVRIPMVKSVAGADVSIVSGEEKGMFAEMKENMEKERLSRQDKY